MKRYLQVIRRWLAMLGFDPCKTLRSMTQLPSYLRDLRTFRRQSISAKDAFPFGIPYPCLGDRSSESGSASGHYFHQDLLVARRIHLNNPAVHVDAGSRIDGFVAHVASFRPIQVIDIRPLSGRLPNIEFLQADLMAAIGDDLTDHCDSLSCLHALEHFGLGRYGDPVRHDGHLLGLRNLSKILKKGGKFYLSVPIGPQRVEFNAFRVFSVRGFLECIQEDFRVDQFSFVDDHGDLHEDTPLTPAEVDRDFGCVYGCGIFEMTKR